MKFLNYKNRIHKNIYKDCKILKGFTLVEVLVGSFLLLVIFLSVFLTYHYGMKLIAQNKNRVVAVSIAAGELEKIQNLNYADVGLNNAGCYPCGDIPPMQTQTINGKDFSIETRVDYVVDPADGISFPEDSCPNDYKKARVRVSWGGNLAGEISLSEDLAPKNVAQECSETGGILSISVFDAYGQTFQSPLIEIKDPATGQNITTAIPDSGVHFFSLLPGQYKIVVSKSGYSAERTYNLAEIASPQKPDLRAIEGQLNGLSFFIDKLSSFFIETKSPWGMGYFYDAFLSGSKIADYSNVAIENGRVELATSQTTGYLVSITIDPANLLEWGELTASEEKPAGAEIIYQVMHLNEEEWVLIPDSALLGNSTGFADLPVNLSGLNKQTYNKLRIKATLSTVNPNSSPVIYDWQVSWKDNIPQPIPNVSFHLQGSKIIGRDVYNNLVYKYSQNHSSNGSGTANINDLEWDSYNFSVNSGTLDLISAEPASPVSLDPDSSVSVILYLQAQNSLLLSIKDKDTGEPIFSATCRLRADTYDSILYSDESGKTYFIPLDNASYVLDVTLGGYSSYSGTVSISGDLIKTINLERIE